MAGPGGITPSIDQVTSTLGSGVHGSSDKLTQALNKLSQTPDDPAAMFEVQKALAVYNLSITMESAVVKSLEDTMKSFTNRI